MVGRRVLFCSVVLLGAASGAADRNQSAPLERLFVEEAELTVSGFSVAVSASVVVVGMVNQAVFVFDRPRWAGDPGGDTVKLTPSDGAGGFGASVAIAGDTIVVGAPHDQALGSAYVFVKPKGGWMSGSETARLTASDGVVFDAFGVSVAVSGSTIVVGARGDDIDLEADRGSAYVFVQPPAGWRSGHETAKLTASDGSRFDGFGLSVAVARDAIVIGAPFDDVGVNENQGSAYVFVKPGGGWVSGTETARLTAPDGRATERFGRAVALSGRTLVVGAPNDEIESVGPGSAYVFVEPGDGWAAAGEAVRLRASDGLEYDRFGRKVGVSGSTVLVGADGDEIEGAIDQGSAYVFVEPAGGWVSSNEAVKLTASDGQAADQFGFNVAVHANTLVLGAPGHDSHGNQEQGSAYVFGVACDCAAQFATRGTAGDDVLVGTPGSDILCGLDGADVLVGGGGIDCLIGGSGPDLVLGNGGNDELFGGSGEDLLLGGVGDDELRGGSGSDSLVGGGGDDVLWGGAGDDRLTGRSGDDNLSGGRGDDVLLGGPGSDALVGGPGSDRCRGGGDRDARVGCEEGPD